MRNKQGAQKAITAATPPVSDTFTVGTADGRVLAYSKGEVESVGGDGHTGLVSGLALGSDGTAFSIGFDDRVREIRGGKFSFPD